jgi:amino acid adenylation domain-containing protein
MAGQKQIQIASATTVEDSYPLSPMQEEMLLASLSAPHSGVDVEQLIGTFSEDLNPHAFCQAWERVLQRHAILRTGFRLKESGPRQEVHRHVDLQFEVKDWRSLPKREQDRRLETHLKAERRRGFELSAPPLMRLALLHVSGTKHILAWTFHHLIIEEPTLPVLLNEVFDFYEGRGSALPSPRPYRDYIDWVRQRDWSAAKPFWTEQLEGFVRATPLVVSRKQSKEAGRHGGHRVQQVAFSSAETARVRAVADVNSLTVEGLMQGAWAALLSRYSGEENVVFGVVRAARHSSVLDAGLIVGPCVNTLPLRVRVADDLSVLEWLQGLCARNRALGNHEHTPLSEVRRWSNVAPGQPLFESVFGFHDPSWDFALRTQGGSWAKRQFTVRNQPNFPLWVEVCGGTEIRLRIGYDPGRFDETTITRMLGHLRTVLEGMVADVSRRVAELPLLTDDEHHQLFTEWQNTRSEYPRDKCVHELFEAQVARTPNAVALVDDKEDLSYRELDNQANRVAHHLRSRDIRPDVPIGICVRRSAEMVVGLLGILKAGGAYLPLDPILPRERLVFMLEDSGAPVLLTDESLHGSFKSQSATCRVLRLDALRCATCPSQGSEIPHSSTVAPRSPVSADNLAYIVFTSGSSGAPKGVEVSHRSLANLISWHQRAYRVTRRDRVTQLAEFSFDASVWELWPYLTAGASIHIVDEETRASAPDLVRWLNDRKITLSFLPTPLAEEVLALAWPPQTRLRALLTGGDKLHCRPPANLPFGLVNHYGPAENTVVATSVPVAPADDERNGVPPIGRPIDNVQAYVLDPSLRLVPIGVPGELCLAGDGLAHGYRRNPGLTAEKFIPHPFSDVPGARLYKTGDLVRWSADGTLEFLGRVDQQVKIQGFRIEPGEIESQLNWHPAVRESLVLAREDARGQKRLVAYLTSNESSKLASKELSDFLRRTLPDYMVPSVFVHLDAWPLTSSGKLDRGALPEPKPSTRAPRRAAEAPRTPVEETVAKIWLEVLGCPRIGVHDNFLDLGGHSLAAAQAVSRLKESFDVHLSIRSLFAKPTIAGLAKEIERLIARRASPREPVIARVSREAYRVNPFYSDAAAELVEQNCEET